MRSGGTRNGDLMGRRPRLEALDRHGAPRPEPLGPLYVSVVSFPTHGTPLDAAPAGIAERSLAAVQPYLISAPAGCVAGVTRVDTRSTTLEGRKNECGWGTLFPGSPGGAPFPLPAVPRQVSLPPWVASPGEAGPRSRRGGRSGPSTRGRPTLEWLEGRLAPTVGTAMATLDVLVRDFRASHVDFEGNGSFGNAVHLGLVENQLGADGKPVWVGPGGRGDISSAASFAEWFNDVPEVNQSAVVPLTLFETAPGSTIFGLSSSAFFPIDDQLWGNEGLANNFLFTVEAHTSFVYQGGESLYFTTDDDLWVFIDGRLAVDLGGAHSAASTSVDLDTLGLTVGQTYSFDLFYAERQPDGSVFHIQVPLLGPVAEYQIDTQEPVGNGEPFSLRVRPVDAGGRPTPGGLGSVVFTTSDARATVPASFDFRQATPDAGGYYTIDGFVLRSAGEVAITLHETDAAPITATTSVPVVNPPPTAPTLSVSSSRLQEGETFVLSGRFDDPSQESEAHTLLVHWGDGTTSEVLLPAGVTTFSLEHAYTRGLPPGNPAEVLIRVSVRDNAGESPESSLGVSVGNDSPRLAVGGDQFVNAQVPFSRVGQVIDAGAGPFLIRVNYGDGAPVETISLTEGHTFQLDHLYAVEGSFFVTVAVDDGRGGRDSAAFFVDVLLPGVPTDPARKAVLAPGETGTVATLGVSVVYARSDLSVGPGAIIVAIVPVRVADRLAGTYFTGSNEVISASYDVRAVNAGALDVAHVVFHYDSATPVLPTLTYFDRATGQQVVVRPSAYLVDPIARTVTLVLDGRSTPRLQEMTGTVFTIAVPVQAPAPPQLVAPTLVQAVFVLERRENRTAGVAGPSTSADAPTATVLLAASALRPALTTVIAGPAVGGGGSPEDGDSGDAGTGALRELPVVPAVLTDLPGVTLTPAGFETDTGQQEPPAIRPASETAPATEPEEPPATEVAPATPPEEEEMPTLEEEDGWEGSLFLLPWLVVQGSDSGQKRRQTVADREHGQRGRVPRH